MSERVSRVSCLIQDIIECFEQRYGDLMDEVHEGGSLLSHICKVLNSKVWPNKFSNVEEIMMKKQLFSVKANFNQYCQMPRFQGTSFQQIKEGYLQIALYAATFSPVHLASPLKLWQNI